MLTTIWEIQITAHLNVFTLKMLNLFSCSSVVAYTLPYLAWNSENSDLNLDSDSSSPETQQATTNKATDFQRFF